MKRTPVAGMAGNLTECRVFDDLFAKARIDVGVRRIPGYEFIRN